MNQRVDFTQLQGLPVFQDTLAFLQESYRNAFAGLAVYFGPLVIISGVDDLGATYGDGWVAMNGELLPFTGGLKTTRIIIEETITAEIFGDGISKAVNITRKAKLGIAGGELVADFKRLLKPFDETTARLAEQAARLGADTAEGAARIAADAVIQNQINSSVVVKHNIYNVLPVDGDCDAFAAGTLQPVNGDVAKWLHTPTANPADVFNVLTTDSPLTHGNKYQRAEMLEGSNPGVVYKRKFTTGFPGAWSAWVIINNP